MITGIVAVVIFITLLKLSGNTGSNHSRKKYVWVLLCSLALIIIPTTIGVLAPGDIELSILGVISSAVASILSFGGLIFLVWSIYKVATFKKTPPPVNQIS